MYSFEYYEYMQIVTVAPIIRGALQNSLTYFSKEDLEIGSVVMVPIRTREVPAIVLEASAASDSKSSIKSSDYAIRKIMRTKPRRIWTSSFLKAAEYTANFSAQKLGETLLALTPKTILDMYISESAGVPDSNNLNESKIESIKNKFEELAIQGSTRTRLESYQGLVRESFARNESVFICLPSEDDVERTSKELSRGIENYTFVFHSGVTKKRIQERWGAAAKEQHAILAIGTAQYIGLQRYFKTIVLDEEHSRGWKTVVRPLLDLRLFVERYAMENKSTFIIGSPLLRAETCERIQKGAIEEFGRIALRTLSDVKAEIVDPRVEEKKIRENTGKRELVVLSSQTRALIEDAKARREHVFLLASRKGLSPVTSCGDCGALVRCPQCANPLVVHTRESSEAKSQLYICHACGFMREPENNMHETCPNCKGWKLQGIGIGIDRIEQEVRSLSPDIPLYILDGDHAKTRAQAKKIITQFEKSQYGILIATPMAVPLLGNVDNTAIISIDSLFAIPDIRMSERIFALILALREKTTNKFLIQTRTDDTTIFDQAIRGDLATFSENELSLRRAFSYPPYGTIIKITLREKRAGIANEMERLKTFLNDYSPIVSGAMTREPKGVFRMHMILKLADGSWPENKLLAKLRALPHQFTVEVNPDHLL